MYPRSALDLERGLDFITAIIRRSVIDVAKVLLDIGQALADDIAEDAGQFSRETCRVALRRRGLPPPTGRRRL